MRARVLRYPLAQPQGPAGYLLQQPMIAGSVRQQLTRRLEPFDPSAPQYPEIAGEPFQLSRGRNFTVLKVLTVLTRRTRICMPVRLSRASRS